MVRYFPGLLEKHKGNFYRMHHLINLMVSYGAGKILNNQEVFGVLLETVMMAVRRKKDQYSSEVENGKGLTLLQGLMTLCTNSFSREVWVSLVQYLYGRLANPEDIEKCFLQEL